MKKCKFKVGDKVVISESGKELLAEDYKKKLTFSVDTICKIYESDDDYFMHKDPHWGLYVSHKCACCDHITTLSGYGEAWFEKVK